MNVGVDGSFAILKNNTTEGNYSKIVIDALASCNPNSRIYVYTSRVEKRVTATNIATQANVHIKQARTAGERRLWMLSSGVVKMLKRHRVHVYHGLAGRLPLFIKRAHVPRVVTIHSLAYKRFAHDYGWWDRVIRDITTRHACRKASAIVTTSESTRNDLIELMHIAPEKIHVVYPTPDIRFTQPIIAAELNAVRDKYKLPRRYFVVATSLIEHKNVMTVLKAMHRMQDREVYLVLVGGDTDYYQKVLRPYAASHHLMHRLLHITRAHAIDMPSIFTQSLALVAPSRLEGFGLTTLEAQACGVPVIAASGSGLQEAAGEGALYFDPDDSEQLACYLGNVLTDNELRSQLVERGRANLLRFSQEQIAEQLYGIYHQVLKKKHKRRR